MGFHDPDQNQNRRPIPDSLFPHFPEGLLPKIHVPKSIHPALLIARKRTNSGEFK